MAKSITFRVKLNVDGKEQLTVATANVNDLRKAVGESGNAVQVAMAKFNNFGFAMSNVSSAVNGLLGTMQGLTSAYNASQQANTQLTTVMKQRMEATDQDIAKVKEVISAQKELGVVGGIVQLRGAQQVATFLSQKETLATLIPAMNNLLAQQKGLNATEEDAYGVANLMGKAMQGQTSALKRVGITFSEAEANVMKYGTEQQRAAMLAQIITNNVGEMNTKLGQTDAGKIKIASNQFGALKVQIGAAVAAYLPMISMASQSLSILTSVSTLANGVKSLTTVITGCVASMGTWRVTTMAVSGAATVWNAVSVRMSAMTQLVSAAFKGAAVSAGTLKLAIQGLMISTGVMAAVYALCTVIGNLVTESDKASASVEGLSQEQLEAKQAHERLTSQIAQQNAALDINIQKLKNFKGSKADEKKLVEEMNTTYGSTMGYYSSVAQWYTALTANSKAYCQQMINEITIRDLANQAAKEQQTRHDIQYDENGKARKYSKQRKTKLEKYENYTTGGGVDRGYRAVEVVGSSDQEKASAAATASYRREQALKKRMETLVKKNQSISFAQTEGYSATAPSATAATGTPKVTPAKTGGNDTEKNSPVAGSLDWYQKAIDDKRKELYAAADAATAKALNAEMEGLQRTLYMLKVKVGIETPPGADILNELKPLTETVIESFEDMQERIKKNPIHVETDPEGLEKMKRKMEDMENVQMLGGTNLQSFESVKRSLESINSITTPTVKGFGAAGEACTALGSAMQQLGADSEAAKAGMVMAAIGNIVLSFAQALASCKTWVEWLAFGIAGTAQMISLVATVSGFAKGGVVGGSSTTGDKVPVRVNSGEMILTKTQQARLFAIANGQERPKMTLPDYSLPKLSLNMAALGDLSRQGTESQTVKFRLEGRSLVGALANETRISSRSGRRSNIKV